MNWKEETIKELWGHIQKLNERYKYTAFEENYEGISKLTQDYAESH